MVTIREYIKAQREERIPYLRLLVFRVLVVVEVLVVLAWDRREGKERKNEKFDGKGMGKGQKNLRTNEKKFSLSSPVFCRVCYNNGEMVV